MTSNWPSFRIRCQLVAVAAFTLMAGCLTSSHKPVPTELAASINERIDLSAVPDSNQRVDPETVTRMIAHFTGDEPVDPNAPRYDVLVLSGGGMYGAFTAGVLVGWSEAGTRPKFHCVTGVSTGALIATLAFLGPEYDPTIARIVDDLNVGKIYRLRLPGSILWSASLASAEPLQRLIESVVDKELLKAVAKAHAEGRRLYVGTTELNSCRLVVWDMGAIASRGDAESLKLFRTVLLASCSIPGFFAPVPIDVEIDGNKYTEMHVDGGASASMFLRFPYLKPGEALAQRRRPLAGSNLYVIVSGKLYADPAPVRNTFRSVASNSLTSVLYAEARGDLYNMFTGSLVTGIKFQMVAIPGDFEVTRDSTSFDPVEIRKLYDEGLRIGRSPYPWRTLPPGPEINEQVIPRTGIRFATPASEALPP
ncbi:MAG TPA: patatin-like phospholipase family protein [Gemmataceae bacterium]|nr:patatin-like phospholipase family protein [Gemmataceae bacterium]